MPKRAIEQDIIEYDNLDEGTLDCLSFSDVEFIKDFGPFKKGEKANNITINFEESTFTEYDEERNEGRKCNIGLVALP